MGDIMKSKMPKGKKITRAKRAGKAAGEQFVAQPKTIAKKTARYR
jgi:hypothetical protein